jgi:hypothetical protein
MDARPNGADATPPRVPPLGRGCSHGLATRASSSSLETKMGSLGRSGTGGSDRPRNGLWRAGPRPFGVCSLMPAGIHLGEASGIVLEECQPTGWCARGRIGRRSANRVGLRPDELAQPCVLSSQHLDLSQEIGGLPFAPRRGMVRHLVPVVAGWTSTYYKIFRVGDSMRA